MRAHFSITDERAMPVSPRGSQVPPALAEDSDGGNRPQQPNCPTTRVSCSRAVFGSDPIRTSKQPCHPRGMNEPATTRNEQVGTPPRARGKDVDLNLTSITVSALPPNASKTFGIRAMKSVNTAPIRPDALRAGATGRPPNAPAPRPHPRRPGRCRDGRNVPPAAPIPATRHSDPAIPAFTTTAKPVPRDLQRDGDATDSHAPFSRGKDGPVHESRRKALCRCTYT